MNILILGSGGREHTFAYKIAQSKRCKQLFVAPGNAGTSEIATNVSISVNDFEAIKKIDRKTLVMTGSDDVGSTPTMSKELVKDLVNSTYIEIQNGKHLCSIECVDDVNIRIKNFINN